MQYPDYGLGRIAAPDDRDLAHLMRAALPIAVPKPATMHWPGATILDQGPYPHCVGYACKQWKQIAPVTNKGGLSATQIYFRAQDIDEWPGNNYAGTSVRAGFKALQEEGIVEEYVWAQSVQDITDWLLLKGPVIVGTNWYSDMFIPNLKGYVQPTGGQVGGHAYLLAGYNSKTRAIRIVNSWGRGWGQQGRAWIHENDMANLLADHGEAVGALERRA
jgi:hypothetical protein